MKHLLNTSIACGLLLAVCSSNATAQLGLGLYPLSDPDPNPSSPARIELGEKLFFETRWSKSGKLSCASCHQPGYAYAEPKSVSTPDGVLRHRRNSMSLLNVAYRATLGWDGSALSLEEQVEKTFTPWGDMGLFIGDSIDRISGDPSYQEGCREAYGEDVNVACVTKAIAAFERSLVSSGSRFDLFLFGGDESALSDSEKRGWELFNGRASCISCHDVFHPTVNSLGGAYATFSDERFHNLGVGYSFGRSADPGRYEITRSSADRSAFKTPMLRNVSATAPYMHDGSLPTLDAVIDFYNDGGRPDPNKSRGLRPLYLSSQEREDLVNFLLSLDSGYPVAQPAD